MIRVDSVKLSEFVELCDVLGDDVNETLEKLINEYVTDQVGESKDTKRETE